MLLRIHLPKPLQLLEHSWALKHFFLLLGQIQTCVQGLEPPFRVDQSLIFKKKNGSELVKTGRYGLGGGGDTPSLSNTDVFSEFGSSEGFFVFSRRSNSKRKDRPRGAAVNEDGVRVTLLIFRREPLPTVRFILSLRGFFSLWFQ